MRTAPRIGSGLVGWRRLAVVAALADDPDPGVRQAAARAWPVLARLLDLGDVEREGGR